MFVSTDFLVSNYGIEREIAKFFVDRQPPKENLYWKDKLLYLRPQPGYLFIPIIIDLLYKCGVSKDELLNESFLEVMEQILHYSAEQEFNVTDRKETIEKSFKLLQVRKDEEILLSGINKYLSGEQNWLHHLAPPYRALQRGDIFLFVFCALKLSEDQKNKIIQLWFALISTLLLLDDMQDVIEDQKSGDENALIESGLNQAGFDHLKQLLAKYLNELQQVNSALAYTLHNKFSKIKELPIVSEFQI